METVEDPAYRDGEIVLSNFCEPPSEAHPTYQRQRFKNVRPCHILLLLGTLTILGSLASALWRAVEFDDLLGGFR